MPAVPKSMISVLSNLSSSSTFGASIGFTSPNGAFKSEKSSTGVTGGTGVGQERTIQSLDMISMDTLSLTEPLTTALDSTSTYEIIDSVTGYEKSTKDPLNIILNTGTTLDDGTQAFTPGDAIIITYTYNTVVYDIQYDLDVNENRIITADVLVKEAQPMYIYFGFKIKCTRGNTITSYERQILQNALEYILSYVEFEGTMQITDIISEMYKNTAISNFVDFIQMTPVFFASEEPLDMTEEQILNLTDAQYTQSEIEFVGPQYPVLGMIAIQKIG
jgi:hypothetical protein